MPPPFRPPVPEPLLPFGAVRPPGVFAVTSPYGKRLRDTDGDGDLEEEWHRALDMGNGRLGAPITTPAPGTVIAEGYLREPWSESTAAFGTGNYAGICIAINHGNDWYSLLAHLRESIVNPGQVLLPHQLIGYLGDTGSAKGAGHVHWDLYHGRPTVAMSYAQRQALTVDPWPLLEQNYRLPDTSTEAAMRFERGDLHVLDDAPLFRLTVNTRLRPIPATTQPELGILPSGTFLRGAYWVDGQDVGGKVAWLRTVAALDTDLAEGFVHESTVERVPGQDSAALQAALDSANQRSKRIKEQAIADFKNLGVLATTRADAIAKL